MTLKKLEPEELERRIERLHKQYVDEKLHCSERTFLVVHSVLETDFSPETVALLSGLAGGIGGTHSSVCGAVTGGIAALGLVYGRRKPHEELAEGSKEKGIEVSRDFFCQFKSRFGSVVCGELIGDLLRKNEADSEERRERCFQYTLNAIKLCIETLSKYEKIYAEG